MADFFFNYLPFVIAGAVVVFGLFLYGLRDTLRLSPGRIWAIGGVCFRDAIRRKVLWVTPLAMLAVIIVSLLQKPVDQPDAIRQTIKFCFFASALVVTIIALITAATNLPREIESRVIYTIVTKPVTRLEIVLGKVVGFARVSAAMLLIMGVFTLGYLEMRAWFLGRQITQTLQSPQLDPAQRAWLQHFEAQGLLYSQTIHRPIRLMQYAGVSGLSDGKLAILGGAQDAIVKFDFPPELVNDPAYKDATYRLVFKVPTRPVPQAPAPAAGAPAPVPELQALILDLNAERTLVQPQQFVGGTGTVRLDEPNPSLEIPPATMQQLAKLGSFNIQLLPTSSSFLYQIPDEPVTVQVLPVKGGQPVELLPAAKPQTRGSVGRFGQQLRSSESGVDPIAIFRFLEAPVKTAREGRVPFEIRVGLERSGADADTEDKTTLQITVRDRVSGTYHKNDPVLVNVENRRTAFFTVPAEWVSSADFDVIVKNRSIGNTIGMVPSSLQLVADREPFAFNLFKGLLVLWLFAMLVAIIAFFCSTFLSWPIAVMLSLLIILGRWAAMNLELGSGFGAQVATDVAGNNPGLARVVSGSVDALTGAFTIVASVLPDIGAFGVTEQIERGATISLTQMVPPIIVLLVFGLPLTVLAYVFLRNKEVAP